jgi:hypothetical protein
MADVDIILLLLGLIIFAAFTECLAYSLENDHRKAQEMREFRLREFKTVFKDK